MSGEADEDLDSFDTTADFGQSKKKEPDFAFLFDIDGVIARGSTPIPEALQMFDLLKGQDGKIKVPVAFVTNACNLPEYKAALLTKWAGEEITPDLVIHAQSPLSVFTQWHKKLVLFIGQGPIVEIAQRLGFANICLIEQIIDAYPSLDIVNHENRKRIAQGYEEKSFPKVEAIVIIGEPVNWESKLQVLIDLLVTNGKPNYCPAEFPDKHLPILACNMDLVFMAEACMPRFGHGAFLLCLESLYLKITGNNLTYTSIIGKPSEITYRFAEHTVALKAKRMGIGTPVKTLYFFGDNPEVDIIGSNLYNSYLKRFRRLSGGREVNSAELKVFRRQAAVASSRVVPDEAEFTKQTAHSIESILVCTGVYKPQLEGKKKPCYVHRDFERASELVIPTLEVPDCLAAVKYILEKENFNPKCL